MRSRTTIRWIDGKTDKWEMLSNPSLRKNPMIPDGPEAPVIYRSLGTYR